MLPAVAPERTLIVVGAGPKALAIAAKRHVLRQLGWRVPKILVIEKDEIAANWCGRFGFTDGHQHLGTPPHKDIGFPYDSVCWTGFEAAVNGYMFNLSWQNYLIAQGGYAKWVDRGRPAPLHGEWGRYLQWVAQKVDVFVEIACAKKISIREGKWRVQCSKEGEKKTSFEGDGIVITGLGASSPPINKRHPRVMNGLTFWQNIESFRGFKGTVAIVGGGETAASIAVALVQAVSPSAIVQIFTSHASIYSRGESFFENQRYTDPHDWTDLTIADREQFIDRTDRGVFSVHANSVLDRAENVRPMLGKATKIESVAEALVLHVEYAGSQRKFAVDRLIWATGFNPLWFVKLLDESSCAPLVEAFSDDNRRSTSRRITSDLSVAAFTPKLHIPMLANTSQGPGFPNLSCLGLLSDRILESYATAPVSRPKSMRDTPWSAVQSARE